LWVNQPLKQQFPIAARYPSDEPSKLAHRVQTEAVNRNGFSVEPKTAAQLEAARNMLNYLGGGERLAAITAHERVVGCLWRVSRSSGRRDIDDYSERPRV
jgi:hypothetical protein